MPAFSPRARLFVVTFVKCLLLCSNRLQGSPFNPLALLKITLLDILINLGTNCKKLPNDVGKGEERVGKRGRNEFSKRPDDYDGSPLTMALAVILHGGARTKTVTMEDD